jgi:hypothetical protein
MDQDGHSLKTRSIQATMTSHQLRLLQHCVPLISLLKLQEQNLSIGFQLTLAILPIQMLEAWSFHGVQLVLQDKVTINSLMLLLRQQQINVLTIQTSRLIVLR